MLSSISCDPDVKYLNFTTVIQLTCKYSYIETECSFLTLETTVDKNA